MKNLLTLLCMAALIVSFTACTKNTYVNPVNKTILIDLPQNVWALYSDGKSYNASLSVPEITGNNAGSTGVLTYLEFSTGVFEQIPEVYNGVSYSYTYNAGNLTVYAQSSDGSAPVLPPQVTVKIVLVSSN